MLPAVRRTSKVISTSRALCSPDACTATRQSGPRAHKGLCQTHPGPGLEAQTIQRTEWRRCGAHARDLKNLFLSPPPKSMIRKRSMYSSLAMAQHAALRNSDRLGIDERAEHVVLVRDLLSGHCASSEGEGCQETAAVEPPTEEAKANEHEADGRHGRAQVVS